MSTATAPLAAPAAATKSGGGQPRVLLLSMRDYARNRAHVTQFEFEDVIAAVDTVQLVRPRAESNSELAGLLHRVKNRGRRLVGDMPRTAVLAPEPIEGEYDLFFAVFHFPTDLPHLLALGDWRRRCRKAVAFVIEMWSKELPKSAPYLPLLNDFDEVFLFNAASVGEVARLVRAPLAFLPTGVDAFRFSPFPNPAPRLIDFMSYGRRSPTVHRQLVEWAQEGELFYHYDTVGDATVPDYWLHRNALASQLRRARYTLAYKVNESRSIRTGGEEALAVRYFEGAAAGTVMLGSRTDAPEFAANFGWDDAVIDLPYATTDLRGFIADLERDPARLARARTANAVHSLRRHDWVYRWAQVLDAVGLPHTPAMAARVAQLHAIADDAEAAPERRGEEQVAMARAAAARGRGVARARPITPRADDAGAPAVDAAPASLAAVSGLAAVTPSLTSDVKQCPNCAERSPSSAVVCRYCGETLPV